jgi:hypothetical protein
VEGVREGELAYEVCSSPRNIREGSGFDTEFYTHCLSKTGLANLWG